MSEQKCTYASALAKNKIAKLEAERDAALACVEQMRVALKAANRWVPDDFVAAGIAQALALQPDLTALRKRDADTLRKAVKVCMGQQYDLRTRQAFSGAIHTLADRIEKGEAL